MMLQAVQSVQAPPAPQGIIYQQLADGRMIQLQGPPQVPLIQAGKINSYLTHFHKSKLNLYVLHLKNRKTIFKLIVPNRILFRNKSTSTTTFKSADHF